MTYTPYIVSINFVLIFFLLNIVLSYVHVALLSLLITNSKAKLFAVPVIDVNYYDTVQQMNLNG